MQLNLILFFCLQHHPLLSLCVCLCLCLSVSVCPSVCLSVSLCVSLSLSVSLPLSVSVCLSVSRSVCYFIGRLSKCVCLFASFWFCVCVSCLPLSVTASVCLWSACICLHLSLCLLPASLSYCISLYGQHASVCISLCVSCLPLSVTVSVCLWSACICLHRSDSVCLWLAVWLTGCINKRFLMFTGSTMTSPLRTGWQSWAVKFCPSTPGKQAAQHRLLFNDINNISNNNCTITDSISISTSSINAYMTRMGMTTITRKMTVIPLLRLPSLH